MYDFAEEVVEFFGGPFSHEELVDGVNWVVENGSEEDLENLEKLEGLMEGAEEMLIDLAIEVAFDMIDENGNDAIEVEEVEDMIEALELDEDEADEVYEGFGEADENEDWEVSWDEFGNAIWNAIEEDPDLAYEIVDGVADFIDDFDVDCDEDGVEGCDDERAAFHEEIASWSEAEE